MSFVTRITIIIIELKFNEVFFVIQITSMEPFLLN